VVPEQIEETECLVRSLHKPYHFDKQQDASLPLRIRPDAVLGSYKYGYDCSVTRLLHSKWSKCKAIAHELDKNDTNKTYVTMLVLCVFAVKKCGIEVLHRPTAQNQAHSVLHYCNASKHIRNEKAAALIKLIYRKKGAQELIDPDPQAPDWLGPTVTEACAFCQQA